MINFINLDNNKILEAAKQQFPKFYIEQDVTDFYLPDVEKGEIRIASIPHTIYVSTHYAYEDRMINGNKTRYKMQLSIIYTTKDAYEVVYDSRDICYVAYEEDDEIYFILYEDFYDKIRVQIEIIEKK